MRPHATHATTRRLRIGLAALVATFAFAGCGGGYVEDDPPQVYVSWEDNANDTVILDFDNEEFAVRLDSRAVVDLRTGLPLAGLRVNGSADLLDGIDIVGGVYPSVGTNGRTIAVFRCNDLTLLDIVISSTGYSITCG